MNINKKYEFTGETQMVAGRILRRIRAVRAFGSVKAGDLGGWIEAESHLSHAGNCWVYAAACVYGNAHVCGNAQVYGSTRVYGNAGVYGGAHVCGYAQVYGDAQVCGNALVYGNAQVYGSAYVCDSARICGNAVCTIDPIVITGLRYTVTITDKHIQIGCQQYTASRLRKEMPQLVMEYKLSRREVKQLEFIISESQAHSREVNKKEANK